MPLGPLDWKVRADQGALSSVQPASPGDTSVAWYPCSVPRTRVRALFSGYDQMKDGFGRLLGVTALMASVGAVVVGAAVWLLLTDPVVVANAVEDGQITPFVEQLATILYNALVGLLEYI